MGSSQSYLVTEISVNALNPCESLLCPEYIELNVAA